VQNEPLNPILPPKNITLTYDNDNRLTNAAGVTFAYDSNGNMTGKGSDTFVYDFEDRLTQSSLAGINSQYGYDGVGNRFVRTEGGVTKRYILDVNRNLTNVLAESDSTGAITAYYVYGLGLISKVLPDGTTYNYHYDSRGSTIALTDGSQAITDAYAYDSFGNIKNNTGSAENPFKYVGKYGVIEEGNGLEYTRARYYAPEIGRFLKKDLLAGDEKDGQSLNRYVYVLNNPVIYIDYDGKMWWVAAAALAGGVIDMAVSSASYYVEKKWVKKEEIDYRELVGVAAGGFVGGAISGGCAALGGGLVGASLCGAGSAALGTITEKAVTNVLSGKRVFDLSDKDWGEVISSGIAGGFAGGVSEIVLPGVRGTKPTHFITALTGAHGQRVLVETIGEEILAPFFDPRTASAYSNGINTPFIPESVEAKAYANRSFYK